MISRMFCYLALVSCLLCLGCGAMNVVKSDEQIEKEKTQEKLEEAQRKQGDKEGALLALSKTVTPPDGPITDAVAQYRRAKLDERKAYVATLIAECENREAELKKKAKRAGYFALGTKGVGVASGITSALLIAVSPANAGIVAGLGAFSSGTAALQDTASSIGYSTVIAEQQLEAHKGSVYKAYTNFGDVPWDYLYSYAGYASQEQWDKEMKQLGKAIVGFEAAIRYTTYEIKFTAEPVETPKKVEATTPSPPAKKGE